MDASGAGPHNMNETDLYPNGGNRIAVFVSAEDAPVFVDNLHKLNRQALVAAGGCAEAIAQCKAQTGFATIVVDISHEAHPQLSIAELAQVAGPSCRLIVIGKANDVVLYKTLLGEGVSEYLLKPVTLDQLAQVLDGESHEEAGAMSRRGRTVAVTGSKGGVGVSTVVAGMAAILSSAGQPTLVTVDFDRYGADQALLSGVKPSDGLRAALESGQTEPRLLLRLLAQVNERWHLLAPMPGNIAPVQSEHVLDLAITLCKMFGLSIWDIPAIHDAASMEILQGADVRVILCDMTVQDACRVKRLIDLIGDESTGQRLMIVMNQSRYGEQKVIQKAQFEEFIGRKIDASLSWAGTALAASVVKGPLDTKVSPVFHDALVGVSNMVIGQRVAVAPATGQPSLLRRLFSGKPALARSAR